MKEDRKKRVTDTDKMATAALLKAVEVKKELNKVSQKRKEFEGR